MEIAVAHFERAFCRRWKNWRGVNERVTLLTVSSGTATGGIDERPLNGSIAGGWCWPCASLAKCATTAIDCCWRAALGTNAADRRARRAAVFAAPSPSLAASAPSALCVALPAPSETARLSIDRHCCCYCRRRRCRRRRCPRSTPSSFHSCRRACSTAAAGGSLRS